MVYNHVVDGYGDDVHGRHLVSRENIDCSTKGGCSSGTKPSLRVMIGDVTACRLHKSVKTSEYDGRRDLR